MRKIVVVLLFYLGLAGIGAVVLLGERPVGWLIEDQWFRPLWLNLAVGALGGVAVGGLLQGVTRAVTRRVDAGEAVAFLNGGLIGLVGALFGLVAYLILELLFDRSIWLQLGEAGLLFFATFLGFRVGYRKENLLATWVGGTPSSTPQGTTKILDTSVIIDGRIGELIQTGFIEGTIVVPEFILDELQRIADSADNLKRRKGRRGLDILGELRRQQGPAVEVVDRDYPELGAVDRKLIQLAKELNGLIVTTDFNLNKVAKVEGITVLNINELANAVKPRFIPGEHLEVEVIDRGEEIGQGVGYLDDGTMVVVENGRRFIGKRIRAVVSSSLQTEAGKMLFVRPQGEVNGGWEE